MFNWSDYLKLSQNWKDIDSSDPLSEAYYRSAISRAYYCVYHNVKEFVKNNGFIESPERKGDRHAEIIDYLNNNDRHWAGGHLDRLKKNRHTSDYKNNKQVDQRFVATSLMFAVNVINDINKKE